MFIVHLFVSYARGNLCHLFSSAWSLCLSCICLSAMHAVICVTFSLPPGAGLYVYRAFVCQLCTR